MASPASYYFSDMWPTSVCVEWPYAYVVGSKNSQSGNYTQEVRKLRIDSYPITVVDYFTYLIRPVSTQLYSCRLSGDYLYMSGGFNSNTVASPIWRFTCIKVDKNDLSSVVWNTSISPHYYNQASFLYDVMPNSADTVVACVGNNDYGATYKLDASAGTLLNTNWITGGANYAYSILGFYNSDASVDIAGNISALKTIWRHTVSSWAYAQLYSGGSSTYYGGELYSGSYYLGGVYAGAGTTYQKPVWRLLQSTGAITWVQYIDDLVGTTYEYNACSTVDGPGGYVYTSGYSGSTPAQGTLSKYDLNGNFQWAVNYGNNDYPPLYRNLVNYGDYLIGVETNASTAGTGWLRLRNKSDGAIANLPPMGHYFPTFFQGTTF